jgi:hypothetical protein
MHAPAGYQMITALTTPAETGTMAMNKLKMNKPNVIRLTAMLGAAAAIAAMSAFSHPAKAEIEYPWCAQLSEEGGGGARNCGFDSFEQCMQTVRGIGGICEENSLYRRAVGAPAKRVPKRKTGH